MSPRSVARTLSAASAGGGVSQEVIEGGKAGTESTLFQTLNWELRERALHAVTEAIKTTLVLVPVAGGAMLIVDLCMKWEKLFGKAVFAAAQEIAIESFIRLPSFLFGLDGFRALNI
ncbi:uncharacterized protein BDW70DRAFT_163849 [Aspergillus foveolatus]|uniref:uncharacterized protein n=1 Tax=Aspergillus foveolatus TaxID=210207 RepID=UPI003CCD8E52